MVCKCWYSQLFHCEKTRCGHSRQREHEPVQLQGGFMQSIFGYIGYYFFFVRFFLILLLAGYFSLEKSRWLGIIVVIGAILWFVFVSWTIKVFKLMIMIENSATTLQIAIVDLRRRINNYNYYYNYNCDIFNNETSSSKWQWVWLSQQWKRSKFVLSNAIILMNSCITITGLVMQAYKDSDFWGELNILHSMY